MERNALKRDVNAMTSRDPNGVKTVPLTEANWKLVPPAADVCQVCATAHAVEHPHNQQSIYYQYWFHLKHGRWPTWADAMEHCAPSMKDLWTEELGKRGITI